jgi:hypothetical protein
MNRLVLTALIASAVVACGDNGSSNNNNNNNNNNKVAITLFVAAPDTIDAGGVTQLVFAVSPPGTSANINGVGDVTGRTQIMVTPTATTTYQLTATDGKTTANSSVTVTVKPVMPPPPPPPPPVAGLVYTNPTSGRVRLVVNAAKSTPQVVQLDMVATERLEVSSFFGGGPGSFASGMNLPLDTTRVDADTTLFATGDALVTGPAATPIAPVGVGRIGTDHVLYTGVSRKRVAGPVFNQETEVKAGQVFYSVRLKLLATATAGTVFDGAQPAPLFRAAIRDQYGDDFVNQGEFGIGKLEVR